MTPRKKRILLVDDEVSFTRLLKLNLQETGDYIVEVANDPAGAFAAAEAFKPDLLLLDVLMPGLDGGQLAAHFQAHPKTARIPIVFLTAAVTRDEISSHGGYIGGLPFIAKPVDLPEITAVLQKFLGAAIGAPAAPAG